MRALCLIREQPHYRHHAFMRGLKAAGYNTVGTLPDPKKGDVLVIWNRYGGFDEMARQFERAGATVIVAENGYLGVDFNGKRWYALAKTHHNGAGLWNVGGPERWDSLGVDIKPYREGGSEVVILPQRGIGPEGVAMPPHWLDKVKEQGRVRPHPGMNKCVPLEDDLKDAKAVITWGSGAALKALLLGIPVFYAMRGWIGAGGATKLELANFTEPQRPERLAMFRRLAWAMWTVEEIESGEAFKWLLS